MPARESCSMPGPGHGPGVKTYRISDLDAGTARDVTLCAHCLPTVSIPEAVRHGSRAPFSRRPPKVRSGRFEGYVRLTRPKGDP